MKFKTFDFVIIFVLIAAMAIGVLVYFGKNKFNKSPVEATKKVAFQVMLRSVSLTDNKSPFVIGEESFITIRNVPYTKLQIVDTVYQPKKILLPTNNSSQPFIVVDDYSQPSQYDFVVTLVDDAKITKDGAVVGGNKIKIGLPIVLEGFNYRIGGTISNVQVLEDKDYEAIEQYVETQKAAKVQNQPVKEVKEDKKVQQKKSSK